MAHPYAKHAADKVGRARAKNYQSGGSVPGPTAWVGKVKLRDAMGGKPPWSSFKSQRETQSADDEMRGQMFRSQAISDIVPRGKKED